MVEVGLKQYFDYIKSTYLVLFEKKLSKTKKEQIKNITNDVIKINEDSEFKIKVDNQIIYNTNLEKFIKNNNLENDDFSDLTDFGISNINYYLDNRNNVDKIIKESMIQNIVILFIGKDDILSLGVSAIITKMIACKCHLEYKEKYQKEKDVIINLMDIVGENELICSVINNDIEYIKNKYDKYASSNIKNMQFDELIKGLNKLIKDYMLKSERVYYTDSLYYYEKIDYTKYLTEINKIKKEKLKNITVQKNRIYSIQNSVKYLNKFNNILSKDDQLSIYYANVEIDSLIKKITNDFSAEKYYQDFLKIEDSLKKVVENIWLYSINDVNYFYLVENLDRGYKKENNNFVVANLISKDFIQVPNGVNRYKYGFIYKIKPDSIVYMKNDKIIYQEIPSIDQMENVNNFYFKNHILEIENQDTSILLTPDILLKQSKKDPTKFNSVLLYRKCIIKVGVFCICESEEDIAYKKASDLASKFDLEVVVL